jgi:hypothetical protein
VRSRLFTGIKCPPQERNITSASRLRSGTTLCGRQPLSLQAALDMSGLFGAHAAPSGPSVLRFRAAFFPVCRSPVSYFLFASIRGATARDFRRLCDSDRVFSHTSVRLPELAIVSGLPPSRNKCFPTPLKMIWKGAPERPKTRIGPKKKSRMVFHVSNPPVSPNSLMLWSGSSRRYTFFVRLGQ